LSYYKSDHWQKFQAKLSRQYSFHRITVGLKGGILRVASAAERLLLKLPVGGRAPGPGCGRVCPALGVYTGGLLAVAIVGSCWRDCLVVGLPAAALGVDVPVCLRFRRGRALGSARPSDSESPGPGVPVAFLLVRVTSVCLHCVVCTCLCQCTGGGDGGQQHSMGDPRIIAFGGGDGGIAGGGGHLIGAS
jgi:hypothetical protein